MNIPNEKHWAVITTTSIYVPGDDRSRTHPGHGYPEHYEESIIYQVFTDFDKLTKHLECLIRNNLKFDVIEASPLKVETCLKLNTK